MVSDILLFAGDDNDDDDRDAGDTVVELTLELDAT